MANENKLSLIRSRLEEKFQPTYLVVTDDSDKHQGHAGHQGGGRHFTIHIAAEALQGLSRIAAHRQIYALFADLMPDQIHALCIHVRSQDDK